jgi:hypothetical protein
MNSLLRVRHFLLGGYHDLPNVLFVGSLILGSISGYLPLVWVAVGMMFNGLNVAVVQAILGMMFPLSGANPQIYQKGNKNCGILFPEQNDTPEGLNTTLHMVAPSVWLASTLFFATFSIYNSIRVGLLPKVKGANEDKADARRALTLTTFIVGLAFLILTLLRGFSGCETMLGGILGGILGIGGAIGFWHILDACGNAMVPDVLQIVNSLPPPGRKDVPVVCSPKTSS